MPDTKITALAPLDEPPAPLDVVAIVDVSESGSEDSGQGAGGTTKKITHDNLIAGLAASGTNADITSMAGLNADGIPLSAVATAAGSGANSNITSMTGLSVGGIPLTAVATAAASGDNADITSMTGLSADGIPLTAVANAASDGANSDITSLTGLTTPLAATQGGTGEATVQDAINTLTGASSSVTDNYVLTKDSSHNAVWAEAPGASGSGEDNTASTYGGGTDGALDTDEVSLFRDKNLVDLRFKALKEGSGITLTSNANDITIESGGEASLPVADSTAIVEGATTDTKKMRIDVETNVDAGETRVLTMPNNDVDLGNMASSGTNGDITSMTALGATPFIFEGATADDFETSVVVTDPTVDRTVTIPDRDVDLASGGTFAENSHSHSYLPLAGGTLTGDLLFEGATADDYETTLTVTDPTADRTITLPNDTGTVSLEGHTHSYLPLAGGTLTGDLLFEGATADDYETTLTVTDPTADRTVTLPNNTGTVVLDADIGSSVQAYDAETAKTDTAQAWTGSQRAAFYTSYADDTATFYMNTAQNWTWTVTSSGASSVTFELESGTSALTNANGQSGYILLTNAAGTITLNATTTDVDTDLLTTISAATGTFLLSYICDGSKVYLTNSKALT